MREITDNLILIQDEENRGRYPHSNSVLVRDERKVLIDVGLPDEDLKKLAKDNDIDYIINSHCHEDHVAFNHIFGSKVFIHETETQVLKDLDELVNVYIEKEDEKRSKVKDFLYDFVGYGELNDVIGFEKDHTFDLGDTKLRAIHTPGHSKGHCAFFDSESKILISADVDFTTFGPWYGALDSDITDFIQSIRKIRDLEPEVIVPGHGEIIKENINERIEKYLGKIDERENKILSFLTKEKMLNEMVGEGLIYQKFPDYMKWMYRRMEKIMIRKHLEKLLEEERITRENSKYKKA